MSTYFSDYRPSHDVITLLFLPTDHHHLTHRVRPLRRKQRHLTHIAQTDGFRNPIQGRVISERFRDARTPISRHRLVNDALKEEVATDGPVHALSIVAMTPEKWQERVDKGEVVGPSPNCRGGDGSLPKKNEASI